MTINVPNLELSSRNMFVGAIVTCDRTVTDRIAHRNNPPVITLIIFMTAF
jgi:hypothetical protein